MFQKTWKVFQSLNPLHHQTLATADHFPLTRISLKNHRQFHLSCTSLCLVLRKQPQSLSMSSWTTCLLRRDGLHNHLSPLAWLTDFSPSIRRLFSTNRWKGSTTFSVLVYIEKITTVLLLCMRCLLILNFCCSFEHVLLSYIWVSFIMAKGCKSLSNAFVDSKGMVAC